MSCDKEPLPSAEFTVDYMFFSSGSMTRGAEVSYGGFYANYIEPKVLTPTKYSLTFINRDNAAVTNIAGKWSRQDMIKLPVGTYDVIGTSYPDIEDPGAPSDTVYLSFNTTVDVTEHMTSLNLNASYDSFLLLFNKSSYSSVRIKENLTKGTVEYVDVNAFDDTYAVFMTGLKWDNDIDAVSLVLTDTDGSTTSVDLSSVKFEKGNYYHFNDMSYMFNLPQMGNGTF